MGYRTPFARWAWSTIVSSDRAAAVMMSSDRDDGRMVCKKTLEGSQCRLFMFLAPFDFAFGARIGRAEPSMYVRSRDSITTTQLMPRAAKVLTKKQRESKPRMEE